MKNIAYIRKTIKSISYTVQEETIYNKHKHHVLHMALSSAIEVLRREAKGPKANFEKVARGEFPSQTSC